MKSLYKNEIMDNLFKIVDQNRPNEYDSEFSIMLEPKHPIFVGHFPTEPILPGACLLFIFKKLAEIVVKGKLELDECLNAKFTKLIQPDGQPILIKLNIKESAPQKINIIGKVGKEETAAKLVLRMSLI